MGKRAPEPKTPVNVVSHSGTARWRKPSGATLAWIAGGQGFVTSVYLMMISERTAFLGVLLFNLSLATLLVATGLSDEK